MTWGLLIILVVSQEFSQVKTYLMVVEVVMDIAVNQCTVKL